MGLEVGGDMHLEQNIEQRTQREKNASRTVVTGQALNCERHTEVELVIESQTGHHADGKDHEYAIGQYLTPLVQDRTRCGGTELIAPGQVEKLYNR